MRHGLLASLLLVACAGEASPVATSSRPTGNDGTTDTVRVSGSASASPRPPGHSDPIERAVVRVDPATFEEIQLGAIRIETKPPFRAQALTKEPKLIALVEEMNALDHVMSAGLSTSPPARIERSSDEFFRIMQHGWLATTHAVELRLPSAADTPARRFDVVVEDGGKPLVLGTVAVNDMSYLAIVAGPTEHRTRLGKLVKGLNARTGESVDVPPPQGKRGRYGRGIARGTPAHWPMLRDELYESGSILVPTGTKLPEAVRVEGARSRHGSWWLSVQVPGGLTVVPPADDALVQLSGPPGGPLGFRVLRYRDVKYDAASLEKYVASLHGSRADYVAGKVTEVEIASRKLLALPFRTGDGPSASQRLVVLWPAVYHLREGDRQREAGIAIELTARGDGPPDPKRPLEHETLAWVLTSLFVDLERADH
jgi:hypothetical protein